MTKSDNTKHSDTLLATAKVCEDTGRQCGIRMSAMRILAGMSRCRRLAKDHERSLESAVASAQLAACLS